jgi:excisionase family DNA binding protein
VSALQPRLVTVKNAAVILGLTNFAVYKLLSSGKLEGRYIEGRRMIPVEELDEFIASLPTERPTDGAA